MHVHMHECARAYARMCTNVHVHMHECARAYARAYARMCTCICTCTRAYAHSISGLSPGWHITSTYLFTIRQSSSFFFSRFGEKKNWAFLYWNLRAQFLNKFYFFCQDWYVSTGRETAGLIRWSSNLTVCFLYLAVTSYLRFATCFLQKLSVSKFWFSQRFESWFALFWNMSRYCFACEEADLKITSTKIYEWHGKSIILVI